MVFYLKYRPQILADLDNTRVAALISKYLAAERTPHAFLFTGSKGTGKTSTARIVAKCINCEKPINGQACGTCATCVGISAGTNLDILEIDAASNRGIDEIRYLRETIKLAPTQLKYKVYIIDEVHMLTTEAFNALLKTLEEPPAHALFILATTEIHKVPETIISRCVRVDFHKATADEIAHSLGRIIRGEKIEIETEALTLLSEVSDGSFRDAAKLLEQAALGGGPITKAGVMAMIGSSDVVVIENFLKLLKERKAKELFEIMGTLTREGKNLEQFFLTLLDRLQSLLIGLYTNGESDWSKDSLVAAIRAFSQSLVEQKTALIQSLPFELAIVELCETPKKIEKVSPQHSLHTTVSAVVADTSSAAAVIGKWTEILEVVKQYNHSIAGVLRSCRAVHLTADTLTIEAQYKFHAERLNSATVRDILAKVMKEVVGLDVKIAVVLKEK